MLCSRRALPFLMLHLVLEQIAAAGVPNRPRTKREVDWLDQELLSLLSDPADMRDLSVGDVEERPPRSGAVPAPTAAAPVQNNQHQQQSQNQNSHKRRADENRWKVARLDPIGRFQIPAFRKRKDKTNV